MYIFVHILFWTPLLYKWNALHFDSIKILHKNKICIHIQPLPFMQLWFFLKICNRFGKKWCTYIFIENECITYNINACTYRYYVMRTMPEYMRFHWNNKMDNLIDWLCNLDFCFCNSFGDSVLSYFMLSFQEYSS